MIAFILACLAMLVVAALLLGIPFIRARGTLSVAKAWLTPALTIVVIGAATAMIYAASTKWSWQGDDPAAQTQQAPAVSSPDVEAMVAKLDAHLKDNPNDLNGWLLLGRSYVTLQRYAPAVTAYSHAYDLDGNNFDATLGLAEALVLTDENAFTGRGGQLIDAALKQNPRHPKALWYGGLAALKVENLPLARERFKALLALDPPEQIRGLIERQIQDLSEQIDGPSAASANNATAPVNARKLTVKVSIAPEILKQLKEPMTLFVLARDPEKPGAPVAVQRHQSNEAPLTVSLTVADAMLPTRTLADAKAVQVVARLSKSGMPTEQSGDFAGQADYSFARGEQGELSIVINRQVP